MDNTQLIRFTKSKKFQCPHCKKQLATIQVAKVACPDCGPLEFMEMVDPRIAHVVDPRKAQPQ